MAAAAVTQYRDDALCRCTHSAGAHYETRPGCALCASCTGFSPKLAERIRAAWSALRGAR